MIIRTHMVCSVCRLANRRSETLVILLLLRCLLFGVRRIEIQLKLIFHLDAFEESQCDYQSRNQMVERIKRAME